MIVNKREVSQRNIHLVREVIHQKKLTKNLIYIILSYIFNYKECRRDFN